MLLRQLAWLARDIFDFFLHLLSCTLDRRRCLPNSLLDGLLLPNFDNVLHLEQDFLVVVLARHVLGVDLVQSALLAGVLLRLQLKELCRLHLALAANLDSLRDLICHNN